MARPKKPPGKTLTQWRIDDDIHDMWSENHMDIKLAFVVLLFFGLQHFNTQSWSNTVYLWKWSIWENYPFGLQYEKNTWSLLHVHGVQIGKDGALNMNLTLIQNRQWDSTTKSWTKDLLHRRTGYHNLWVLKLLITQGRCIHAMIGMTLMKIWSPWFFATFDLDGPGSRWPWRCGSCAAAQIRLDKEFVSRTGWIHKKHTFYTLKPLNCFFDQRRPVCFWQLCSLYIYFSIQGVEQRKGCKDGSTGNLGHLRDPHSGRIKPAERWGAKWDVCHETCCFSHTSTYD